MEDVRTRLRVKSIRCRIEKRVLERIGHVLRMGWVVACFFGINGVVVGGYLECEEAECEGDEQEEAEKCGGEVEAGEMGDGVAN